jgi:hypothetical protein
MQPVFVVLLSQYRKIPRLTVLYWTVGISRVGETDTRGTNTEYIRVYNRNVGTRSQDEGTRRKENT